MELKRISVVVVTAAFALTTAAACSSSGGNDEGTPANTGGGNPSTSESSAPSGVPDPAGQPASKITPATMSGDCADYGKYGEYDGASVSIYTSITEPEIGYHVESVKDFERCTGIDIKYQPSKDFEAALQTKVDGGNAPDLAIFPQPGLLQTFAKSGKLKLASAAVTEEAEQNWVPSWVGYGTVLDHYFGAPLGANLKSLIWYSPKSFTDNGYQIPETWDDLIALSDQMVQDGNKPWCVGIESGEATGWPLTDWMEEVMMRKYGPDVYDQWTNHEIPFNDPKVLDVLQIVGSIVKNPDYVNAGIGDVKSIATTPFQDGGKPIEKGECQLHAQANFYAANWSKGTKVAEDGDVFAFYEPTMSDEFGKVTEVGGEFVGAFSDTPEAEAVQLYLASGEWATKKAELNAAAHTSGWATSNQAVDPSVFVDPIDQLSVQILTDPEATARFDASDVMPSQVGTDSFWKQMTQWILGQDDQTTLDKIEESWPQ